MRARIVELGDLTVGELVSEPGWRWSTHVRPPSAASGARRGTSGSSSPGGSESSCSDGTEMEFGPNDVFDIPPEHDGFTVGDEPCVQIEWSGIRAFAGFPTGIQSRVLATLLFTDLVDSTTIAARLGDARWRELLSSHFEAARASSSASAAVRSRRPATACSRRSTDRLGRCTAPPPSGVERTSSSSDPSGHPRRRGRARR